MPRSLARSSSRSVSGVAARSSGPVVAIEGEEPAGRPRAPHGPYARPVAHAAITPPGRSRSSAAPTRRRPGWSTSSSPSTRSAVGDAGARVVGARPGVRRRPLPRRRRRRVRGRRRRARPRRRRHRPGGAGVRAGAALAEPARARPRRRPRRATGAGAARRRARQPAVPVAARRRDDAAAAPAATAAGRTPTPPPSSSPWPSGWPGPTAGGSGSSCRSRSSPPATPARSAPRSTARAAMAWSWWSPRPVFDATSSCARWCSSGGPVPPAAAPLDRRRHRRPRRAGAAAAARPTARWATGPADGQLPRPVLRAGPGRRRRRRRPAARHERPDRPGPLPLGRAAGARSPGAVRRARPSTCDRARARRCSAGPTACWSPRCSSPTRPRVDRGGRRRRPARGCRACPCHRPARRPGGGVGGGGRADLARGVGVGVAPGRRHRAAPPTACASGRAGWRAPVAGRATAGGRRGAAGRRHRRHRTAVSAAVRPRSGDGTDDRAARLVGSEPPEHDVGAGTVAARLPPDEDPPDHPARHRRPRPDPPGHRRVWRRRSTATTAAAGTVAATGPTSPKRRPGGTSPPAAAAPAVTAPTAKAASGPPGSACWAARWS